MGNDALVGTPHQPQDTSPLSPSGRPQWLQEPNYALCSLKIPQTCCVAKTSRVFLNQVGLFSELLTSPLPVGYTPSFQH